MKRTFLVMVVLAILSMSQFVVSAQTGSVAYVRYANDRPICSGTGSLIIGVDNFTSTPNYLTVITGETVVREVSPGTDTIFIPSVNTDNVFNGVVRVIVRYGDVPYSRDYFYGVYWFQCWNGQLMTPEINATDDRYSVPEQYTSTFNLVANDTSNIGYESLRITDGPLNGTAQVLDITNVSYTPNPDFVGFDTFSYRVCNASYCSRANVDINVTQLPEPILLYSTIMPNTCTTTGTLSGEVIFTGGDAFVSATSGVQDTDDLSSTNAALIGRRDYAVDVSGSGILVDDRYYSVQLQYGTMPYTGEFYDEVLWIDCITGLPVTPIVVAVNDTFTAPENFPTTFNVLANDRDGSLLSLDDSSLQILSSPTRGTATVDDSGNVTYTYGSNDNFSGTDTFTYQVCDVAGFCGSATVTVTIGDLPEHAIYGATLSPQTCDATGTAQISVEYSGNTAILTATTGITSIADISSNDTSTFGQQIVPMQVSGQNGGVVGDNVLILDVDYGTSANDATYDASTFYFDCVTGLPITPSVNAVDDVVLEMGRNLPTPIDVLENDTSRLPLDASSLRIVSQPTTGSVEVIDGMPVYTGDGVSLGETSFIYEICNIEAFCDVATVSITIVNLPPVCEGSSTVFYEVWPPNQNLVPIVVQGVYDPDGDPVTFELTSVTIYEDGYAQRLEPDEIDYDAENGLIRAERLGQGNGRIYVVEYRATDPDAQFCDGTAYIYVPHDQRYHGCEVPAVDIDGNPFPVLPDVCEFNNNGVRNGQNNGNGNPQNGDQPPTSEPSDGNNNGVGNDRNVGNAQGNPPRGNTNTGDAPLEPSAEPTLTPTDVPTVIDEPEIGEEVEDEEGENNGLGNDRDNGNAQGDPQRGENNGNAYGHNND